MKPLTLYYATNRNHVGTDRWHPKGYGHKFSSDGMENLRFGKVAVNADEARVEKSLAQEAAGGHGDGGALSAYLTGRARQADIAAFPEKIDPRAGEAKAKLGSQAMFAELQSIMEQTTDVLVYIHGFNVTWHEAVGAALALQCLLNVADDQTQKVQVVLFTWPSDGLALPFVSYKSDRTEAEGSGYAVGRALLKVRDFMAGLRDRVRGTTGLCGQDLHLLCHSMGNYVLQNALKRLNQFTPGSALPRLFQHVFLSAADVDDDVLEADQEMGELHELARSVSVYHNREDLALQVSDHTKGNPERLGSGGTARPPLLHNKVHQIDCTAVVSGLVEHNYHLSGLPNQDLRFSIAGLAHEDPRRRRSRHTDFPNVWALRPTGS